MEKKWAYQYLLDRNVFTDEFRNSRMEEMTAEETMEIGTALISIGSAFYTRGKDIKARHNLNDFLEKQGSESRFDVPNPRDESP